VFSGSFVCCQVILCVVKHSVCRPELPSKSVSVKVCY